MEYILVSLKDRAIEAFLPLGNVRTEGEALRVFRDAITNNGSPQQQHPDDYDLYQVGTFDDQTGHITPTTPPRKIADGKMTKELINS